VEILGRRVLYYIWSFSSKENGCKYIAMRIGLLIGQNQIGGTERQVHLFSKGLAERGISVTVFFMAKPRLNPALRKFDFGNVRCVQLWDSRITRKLSISLFAHYLKKLNISIAHLYGAGGIEYGMPAGRKAGIQNIVTSIRNAHFADNADLLSSLRVTSEDVKLSICNSDFIRLLLVKNNIYSDEIIHVIPNGIVFPPKKLQGIKRKKKRPFTVLFSGRLEDVKNPMCFVRSATIVLRNNPDCRFIIVGGGALESDVRAFVRKSGWANKFILTGYCLPEEVPYRDADVLVSTSKSEGNSNSILEALAHGLPVVATSVGGSTEMLKDRCFGVLVNSGDEKQIAEATNGFFGKKQAELEQISHDAKMFIKNNYTLEAMVNKHLALYESLC